MAIIVDGKNHYQLTDTSDGKLQTKTEQQRVIDGWPPPDGTPHIDAPDHASGKGPRAVE